MTDRPPEDRDDEPDEDDNPEFDRFEALTKKLLRAKADACPDCGHALSEHRRPIGEQTHRGSRGGVPHVCRVCGCRINRQPSASS